MLRYAVIFAVACGAPHETTIAPPLDPCAGTAIRFEVTPPAVGDPAATFAFRWKGEGYGSAAKTVCLVRGAEVERVPRGERREVAIRADPRTLQRIVVGKQAHLIVVTPGATITLGDNPCFFYDLAGPSTDPWFAHKPIAYCAQDCRAGYFHPDPPRPTVDELCGDTKVITRCVAEAEIRFAGTAPHVSAGSDEDAIPLAQLAAAPLRLAPRSCGFATLDTGRDVVALVVGAGERWSLALDATGTLTGELLP